MEKTLYFCDATEEEIDSHKLNEFNVVVPLPNEQFEVGSIEIDDDLIPDELPTTGYAYGTDGYCKPSVLISGSVGPGGSKYNADILGLCLPAEKDYYNQETLSKVNVIEEYGSELIETLERAVENRYSQ